MTLTRIAAVAFFVVCLFASAETARADIEVRVDKAAQRMAVIVDGVNVHNWVVSTGTGGGPPSGSYRPERLERKWFSRTFNWAPMPYSIFFDGPYAIHGTTHVNRLGQRASKGCVRLHPANAAVLFALVQKRGMKNTRIIIGSGGMFGLKKPHVVKKVASLR